MLSRQWTYNQNLPGRKGLTDKFNVKVDEFFQFAINQDNLYKNKENIRFPCFKWKNTWFLHPNDLFGIYITVVLNNIIGIGLVMAKNCSQLVRSNMMFSIALSNKWYIGVTMGRLLGMKGWYMFVFVFMFSHVIHLIVKMK